MQLQCRNETAAHFVGYPLDGSLPPVSQIAREHVQQRMRWVLGMMEINLAYEEIQRVRFSLSASEWQGVVDLVGPHPAEYPEQQSDAHRASELLALNEQVLIERAVAIGGARRQIVKKAYIASRKVELVSHILGVHPASFAYDAQCVSALAKEEEVAVAESLASYCVGLALGRWRTASPNVDTIDPLSPITPWAMARGAKLPCSCFTQEAEYGRRTSLAESVATAMRVMWGPAADDQVVAVCQLLHVSSLEEYLYTPSRFFAAHLGQYSQSRRQGPLYWPLGPTCGRYTIWVYYHALTGETLYSLINDCVEPRRRAAELDVAAMRTSREQTRKDQVALEEAESLVRSLTEFQRELVRAAQFWKPNQNDGVVITAAPLWKLFQFKPWQKKLKETWEALEAGEYDWAHLAYSLWPDRVREKCKHDKSLAIAHSLEDLYQEPPATAGKKRGRKPKVVDPELMEDAE
jgi:hypothetical protein